jgi:deoxyribodipyrimidine photolyase
LKNNKKSPQKIDFEDYLFHFSSKWPAVQRSLTGWMHNRVRMIVASFLVKDLHVDWRKGEKYFAQKLIDYDPAVNNGSWQWAASTGCDAQPYFRIFNPWLQQKRFDLDCIYISKNGSRNLRNLHQKKFTNGKEMITTQRLL